MSNLAEIGINRSMGLLLMLKNFSVLLFGPKSSYVLLKYLPMSFKRYQ